MRKTFLAILIMCSAHNLLAQEQPKPVQNPPINVETLFNNRGMGFQLIVNKKMQSIPRLGLFSVTNLVGEWEQR